MKRTILFAGLVAALVTTALGQGMPAQAVLRVIDEGAQLGSAYPEITHWPHVTTNAGIDEGAQLGSAYPEITHWPDREQERAYGGRPPH